MGYYSMPSYFQTMPVPNGMPYAADEKNAEELKKVEQELHEQMQKMLAAGVPDEKIDLARDELEATTLLRLNPGSKVYLFYGTDSLALAYRVREKIVKLAEEAAK